MKRGLDARVIVFNFAAVLIAVTAVAAVVRSWVFTPSAPPCSERYINSTVFALERGGVTLTAADLQSSVGGMDAGVIDNLSIAKLKDGPGPIAMAVNLPTGSSSPHGQPRGGISFPWQPRVVRGKSAVCLSYSVLLPADFQFSLGGTLPGIAGEGTTAQAPDGFIARLAWRQGDAIGATIRVTSAGETSKDRIDDGGFGLPSGRWVKLDQEVVLNTPKQADGIVRVWVDGRLAIERTDAILRSASDVTVSGVAADVHYGTEETSAIAPKDTRVKLTPFEMRW
jgi:hypothetical protein